MKNQLLISIKAAVKAGSRIVDIYNTTYNISYKDDKTPLTEADRAGHEEICQTLGNSIPILSEEGKAIPYHIRKPWESFWMVDPLDGTKEFIKRNGEFTVNIALIKDNKPVLGIIYAPIPELLYFGADGIGSYRLKGDPGYISHLLFFENAIDKLFEASERLPLKTTKDKFTIVASRSHMSPETETYIDDMKAKYGKIDVINKGSSLKICLVAEGSADTYPRFAPTMEWDVAAGHAIAKYAGFNVTDAKTKQELIYNKQDLLNPWFLVSK